MLGNLKKINNLYQLNSLICLIIYQALNLSSITRYLLHYNLYTSEELVLHYKMMVPRLGTISYYDPKIL